MGNQFGSSVHKRVYLRGMGLDAETFSLKMPVDLTVGELSVRVQKYLVAKRINSFGHHAQQLIYHRAPLAPEVLVRLLFVDANSRYFNNSEDPIYFVGSFKTIWVQVTPAVAHQNRRTQEAILSFQVAVDSMGTVSSLRVAIETVQAATKNYSSYGHGVTKIRSAGTGEPAPMSEWICNLYEGVNDEQHPINFEEQNEPISDIPADLADQVIARYRARRT